MSENEKQQICKYYRDGACIAQGELKVACWVPAIEKCRFRKNPKFDKVTEMQHDIKWILKSIIDLSRLIVNTAYGEKTLIDKKENIDLINIIIEEAEKRIESLKEKMWVVREE